MKKVVTTFILVLLVDLLHAQLPLVKQWDYRFGGTDYEVIESLQQVGDGGYILGGYSMSDSSGNKTQAKWGNYDYWLIKTDSFGNKQWDKDFGGTDMDILTSLYKTTDGGYILGGYSLSGISGDKTQTIWGGAGIDADYWIVKIDSLGSKQWDKDFGGTNLDELFSIQQTTDGGYIMGGYSKSDSSGNKTQPTWGVAGDMDYWIVKTDSIGYMEWDKDFGGIADDFLTSIQQTSDGGYIVGGYSSSEISGDKTQPEWGGVGMPDYWILKIDSLGNKEWDKDFGGTGADFLVSIQQTVDHGYVLGGFSHSGISGNKTQPIWGTNSSTDYWIVKIDSLGSKQWDKDFGGTSEDELFKVTQTTDTGYLISGDSYSPISGNKTENNLGQEQTWVIKTDSLGNKQWDKTLFTSGHDENGLVIQTKDGCYAFANCTSGGIAGYKTQVSWGSWDWWLIKFCDSTSTSNISQSANLQSEIIIYPSPTTNTFTIKNISLNDISSLEVFNSLGEIVYSAQVLGKSEYVIDANFARGFYFVRAGNGERTFVKKLIIE